MQFGPSGGESVKAAPLGNGGRSPENGYGGRGAKRGRDEEPTEEGEG